jgi:putative membrane protein
VDDLLNKGAIMNRFILRWLINAVALYAAISLVPGLSFQSTGMPEWAALALLALVFGFVNALLRPVLKLLTCPLIILTLGLFTLVINTGMLYLTSWIGDLIGLNLTIQDFWSAFVGALVISVVSILLSLLFKDELKRR